MTTLTTIISGIAALTAVQASPAAEPEWTGVRVCFQEQIACAAGQCAPERIEQVCNFDALDPDAAAVVRQELRWFAGILAETPDLGVCAADVARRIEAAAASIRVDGPLELMEPYAYTAGSDELSSAIEAELYWRAQLEERASGLARQRHMAQQAGEDDGCGLPALVDVVQLRAQNLAFAESVGALDMARNGALSDPALWGVWFIYNHADLWQPEQAEAAAVFDVLAERGTFPASLARGLEQRVAAHQTLYSPDQLTGGWPE